MIYPIYAYGHPVLRKKAQEIDETFDNLPGFIENMFESMEVSDGVGLAAPQVGKSLRFFVIDAQDFAEEYPEAEGFRKVFINPIIEERTGDVWEFIEGCLSLPGINEGVMRPTTIKMTYLDEHFTQHIETFDGILARIIQHEYDHLEGILFVDHLSALRKRMLKKRFVAIEKGIVDVAYKIKFPKK
ncbi:MAG: peptide deformylase [Bacteroidales bacterium]|jgi:peptide deformylase|nr:peptide deformylase [Bacteroidales bacterium]